MLDFYKCYVDDMLSIMFNVEIVEVFLLILNDSYFLINFIMELVVNGKFFFLGVEIVKYMFCLEIKVYKKLIDIGLLLYY